MLRLLLIPVTMLLMLVGAILWSGGGVQRPADFTFINRGDVFTLDLNRISYMQDFRVAHAIREGLFRLESGTLRPVPGGAVRHEISLDGKTWTFHLRRESRWSNGDPVVAQDYVFSWRRQLEEPGEYTYLFYYITNAREYEKAYSEGKPADFATVGIQVLDDHTLRLALVNPAVHLPDLLAFPPFYPRHAKSMEPFEQVQKDGRYTYRAEHTRPPHVVTNGAFNLTRWDFKRRLRFEKSPTYWDAASVKCNTMEMVVNDDALGQFLQYESGGVDWIADVPPDYAAELRARGRKDLRVSPALGTAFMTLLCKPQLPASLGGGTNPLAKLEVRRALAMAMDKRFIVERITRMGEQPATTYVPPHTLPGYTPPEGLPYNVAEARRLLAAAGYPDGRGFPPLPILYPTSSAVRERIAQRLKNDWKQALNIDLEIQAIEGKIFSDRVSAKDYAIATVSWYGDYLDVSTFTDKYLSNSLQNDSGWENPEYDRLCAEAARELDRARRLRLLQQAEQLINTEVPIIPMYYYLHVGLCRDHVKGVTPNPRNFVVWPDVQVER